MKGKKKDEFQRAEGGEGQWRDSGTVGGTVAYHSDEWVVPQAFGTETGHVKTEVPWALPETTKDVHVSQRMGNSLCSQPALFMSALGGIRTLFGRNIETDRGKMERTNKLGQQSRG